MGLNEDSHSRDRRGTARDRRRRLHDRRLHGARYMPPGPVGRVVRWATGSWTSANGLSWFRLAVLIVIVRWGFLAVYTIPTSSMEPTLHGDPRFAYGDRVLVNKLAFGPRIPFTKTRLFDMGEPQRWDIVVFDDVEPGASEDFLIKRIVGLPGERVRIDDYGGIIRGGPSLRINGELVEPPEEFRRVLQYGRSLAATKYVVQNFLFDFASHGVIPVDLLRMEDERIPILQKDLKSLQKDVVNVPFRELSMKDRAAMLSDVNPDSVEVVREWWTDKMNNVGRARYGILYHDTYATVPEGHYFCLGDNGPESIDSRFFGWVPKENLVGRAFAVGYPPRRVQDLSGFSREPLGALVLYGLTLLVILWEIIPGFFIFVCKVRGPIASLGLRRGDRVLVNRIAYGLRLPFSNRHLWWRRDPEPGEVVCYSLSRETHRGLDLYFGDVRAGDGSGAPFSVRAPGSDGDRWLDLGRDDIVGCARSIAWPLSRRGSVQAKEKL